MPLVLLLLYLLHPIHISVCEVDFDSSTKTFQFSQRIFADDLESAINKANNTRIDILKISKDDRDNYLKKYLEEKIEMKVNNKSIPYKYVGSEIEEGVCWIYYESTSVSQSFNSLSIKNIVLFEMFKDQTTIIQVTKNEGESINFRLTLDKTEELIPFN